MFALLAAFIAAAPGLTTGPNIIENDYPKALAKAKASKKLLMVDAWAPWCHSCLFMREHVMNQPAFAAFEKDIVFASIDTEQPQAAAFLAKFPVVVWPTLYFIDPSNETVRFRWAGSADAAQMTALLSAAQQRDARVVEADALFAKGDSAAAAQQFLAARKAGDDNARATLSLISALSFAKQNELCAKTADTEGPRFETRSDQILASATGLGCALELSPGPVRDALVGTLVQKLQALINAPEGLMADDVSSGYELLVGEREQAHDEAGQVELAKTWLSYLDQVAGQAKTPSARAAFDAHRVEAAIASKQPQRMIAPLLQSEKELPLDYNPAARLALIYQAQGELTLAQAAIARALPKCRGPRKLRLFSIQAQVFEKLGDGAGRKKSLLAALAYAKTLPAVQRPTKAIAALEASLKSTP